MTVPAVSGRCPAHALTYCPPCGWVNASDGSFPPRVRAAIVGREDGRCAGCGSTDRLECQHRRARGMGGTTRGELAHPANGVPLCARCHAWTEAHPDHARALGWRLDLTGDPLAVPYYSRAYGWRRVDPDGLAVYVDPIDDTHLLPAGDAWRAAWAALRRLQPTDPDQEGT